MAKRAFIKLACVCSILLVLVEFCYVRFGGSVNLLSVSTGSKSTRNEFLTRVMENTAFSDQVQSFKQTNTAVLLPHDNSPKSLLIEEKVEKCMTSSNLRSELLLTQARDNARYFINEYRRVIPERGLEGYRSHCWREDYYAKWEAHTVSGSIGDMNYSQAMSYYPFNQYLPKRLKRLSSNEYNSSILCLPKVYLLGYEKCGSTFLYSFMAKLASLSTNKSTDMAFLKETQYWARFEAYQMSKRHLPTAESLGMYLLNYIPGMDTAKQSQTDMILIDGTPNYMVEWPVFSKDEDGLSNYCLLPAGLPTLFPDSKYFAIMRSPIDMVYSNFWFSCTKYGIKLKNATDGPDIFHKRIMPKIHTFNNCVRNELDPAFSAPCSLDTNYSACIRQRTHLLDKCSLAIIANKFSPELRCGETTLYYGLYYIHVRKWLSLVKRENLFFLTMEELTKSPNTVATDILQFLDLKMLSSDEIQNFSEEIMKTGNKKSQTSVQYKSNPQLHMRADTRQALETFYRPFNLLLAELLGSNKYDFSL